MANHTPGPWHKWSGVHPDGRHFWVIGPGDGFPAIGIANVEQLPATRSGKPCNRLELHYNAALVSAAPELLVALIACRDRLAEWVDSGSPDYDDHAAVRMANKAIEKATEREDG